MTDRYKGFIVHLDKDIRSDDSEDIIIALKTIKHVINVTPLVTLGDDHIAYLRGKREIIEGLNAFIKSEIFKKL